MNYSPIEKLTEELSNKVQDLKSGKLDHVAVNELVKTAQEVYNRMVILQFQMHEKGNAPEAEPEETPIAAAEIEEEEEEIEEVEEETVMPEFNMNMTGAVEEEESVIEEEPEVTPEPEMISEPEPEPIVMKETELEITPEPVVESVAEMAEHSADGLIESVAEKFEHAPISSISKGYSLNEKFQFMRVFTGNNSEQFSALVETLNSSANLNSAMELFQNSVSKPDGEDVAVYDSFKELITRRFS